MWKKPLCLRCLLFKQSTRCMEFILTAVWGGSAWRLPLLLWLPLAVKTKTPSGVCVMDLWPVQEAFPSLSGGCWERPGKAAFQKKETSFSWDAHGELTHWGHLFSTVTNSSSTPMLTRPNFLKLPLSFTPLWIFNYADKELRKPLLIPLSPSLTARLRFLTCPTWELHLSPCT